MGEGQ